MLKKLLSPVLLCAATGGMLQASEIQIGGFGTFVGGYSDIDRQSDTNLNKSHPGYVNTASFLPESLFGLQVNADITGDMGAVVQIKAQHSDRDQKIKLEWGYAYFDLSDEFRLIIGRYRPAIFLYSNYRDVGYAYPWITLPGPVYMHSYLTNIDGVNANYVLSMGEDFQLSTTVFGGNGISGLIANNNLPINFDDVIGIEMILSNDVFRLRFGYDYSLVTVPYVLMADVDGDGKPDLPTSGPIYEELKLDRSPASIYSAGFDFEYEGIVMAGEYFVQELDKTVFNRTDGWYAMGGYRFGDFLPHYTFSRATSNRDHAKTGVPAYDAVIDGARMDQLENTINNTVGLRYEINSMAAVKAEWTGTVNQDAHRNPGKVKENYNVYKIALNVIF